MKSWAMPFAALCVVCFVGCPASDLKPLEVVPDETVTAEEAPQAEPESLAADVARLKAALEAVQADAELRNTPAVNLVKKLGGTLEYDGAGRIVGVDLNEIQVSDADMGLLTDLVHLRKLYLWAPTSPTTASRS